MFTGIVRAVGVVETVQDEPNLRRLSCRAPGEFFADIQRGASVSVDGACLTVVEQSADTVRVDAMAETLRRTIIGRYEPGRRVNLERAARFGDEIGGHLISGHVDTIAEVSEIRRGENLTVMDFTVESPWERYLFSKGYVAINGASLTIVSVDRSARRFSVSFIPETFRATTFGEIQVGAAVNIEIDRLTQAVVETTEHALSDLLRSDRP